MLTPNEILKNNKSFLSGRAFSIIAFCMLIVIGISCTSIKKEPYTIIKINAKGNSYNYSRSLFGYVLTSDSIHSTAMMVGKGDVLLLDKDDGLYYNVSNQQTEIIFKQIKPFDYINGKIHTIYIEEGFDLLPWFKQMKPNDISGLQSLNISSSIPETYYPYLKEIAKVKPDIGLFFEEKCENKKLLKYFKPIFLMGMTISPKDSDILTFLSNLGLLVIALNDSLVSFPLPHLPQLKQLILQESESMRVPKDFLVNNTQIQRLTFLGKRDFSFIGVLNHLKELSIVGLKKGEPEVNLQFIKEFKELESLSIIGDKYTNLSSMNELIHLRWLSLHVNTAQKDFTSIIEHHKTLEVLEIQGDSIDLHPLLQLKNLYGLVVVNAKSVDPVLLSMKNLKYLSVSNEIFKDSAKVANLQKSLSGCTIVPNEGFCMGSGWLFLLLPFTIVFSFFLRWKRKHLA